MKCTRQLHEDVLNLQRWLMKPTQSDNRYTKATLLGNTYIWLENYPTTKKHQYVY